MALDDKCEPRTIAVTRIESPLPAGHVLSRSELTRFELADVSERTTESIAAWKDVDDLAGKTLDPLFRPTHLFFGLTSGLKPTLCYRVKMRSR